MKILFVIFIMLIQIPVLAREIPLDETASASYYLSLKVKTDQPDSAALCGTAVVEILIVDQDKSPVPGIDVLLQANFGTFQCYPVGTSTEDSGDESDMRACFKTNSDGIARVHFINIPFNVPVNIKAAADCNGMAVHGKGYISLTRTVKKVKKQP